MLMALTQFLSFHFINPSSHCGIGVGPSLNFQFRAEPSLRSLQPSRATSQKSLFFSSPSRARASYFRAEPEPSHEPTLLTRFSKNFLQIFQHFSEAQRLSSRMLTFLRTNLTSSNKDTILEHFKDWHSRFFVFFHFVFLCSFCCFCFFFVFTLFFFCSFYFWLEKFQKLKI